MRKTMNSTMNSTPGSNDPRSGLAGMRLSAPPAGVFGKLLTIAVGALLFAAVFMFSLLALAVLVAGGIVVLAYLQWTTRHLRAALREEMRQQMQRDGSAGRVLEGEIIGKSRYDESPRKVMTLQDSGDD